MKFLNSLFELLPKLSLAFGPTGCEKRVLELIEKELEGVCDCSYDAIGNLVCRLPGNDRKESCAFITGVDELGFMITKIDDKGYIRVECTGNGDPACFIGKKMLVGNENELLEGVGAGKVLHLLSGGEYSDAPSFERLFIDLGTEKKEKKKEEKDGGKEEEEEKNAEKAGEAEEKEEAKFEIGDFAAYKGDYFELPNNYLVGKALECRANCAVLVTLLKHAAKLKKEERRNLFVIFAVKEKVGFSGAVTALHRLAPDRAVLLGFEPSFDLDEKDGHKKGAILGKGPVLTLKDGRALFYDNREFFDEAKNAVGGLQVQILDGSLSLSSARGHQSLSGIPMVSLRLPCHNPETPYVIVSKEDIEWMRARVWALALAVEKDC